MTDERRYRCPVCGWDRLPRPAWVEDSPSFDICPCCGTQYGYQDHRVHADERAARHAELRGRWVADGAPWTHREPPPEGWDPGAQLAALEVAGPDVLVHAVEVSVAADEVDLVAGLLWGAGVSAVAEDEQADGTVVLRTDLPPRGWAVLDEVLGDRWPWEIVGVDSGLDGWRAHARVVRAGPIVVRPPWVPLGPVAPGEVVVEIDPAASFGHGAHPTTRLCLALLADLFGEPSDGESLANRRVDTCPGSESLANRRRTAAGPGTMLDVGCGSGVLAIAAVVLGARSAVAVDIEPEAIDATRANAERNGVAGRVEARLIDDAGDIDDTGDTGDGTTVGAPETGFDVVVANIGAAALRDLAPRLVGAVAPGGTLVLSGLLDPPPPDLAAGTGFAPLVPVATKAEEGWSALVLAAPTA